MPEKIIIPIDGLNKADPSYLIGDGQCSELINLISINKRVKKFPGTHRYNQTAHGTKITSVVRYYGILADGTKVKKTFCTAGASIYYGDEVTGTLTAKKGGFTQNTKPEYCVMQEGGVSIMFHFNGKEYPYYHNGNDAHSWYKSSIPYRFVQGVEWQGRLWGFEENSSTLYYSKVLYPQNHTDTTDSGDLTVANDKDSVIRRIMVLGNFLFVFKNNGIYYIQGSSPATYGYNIVTKKYGLAGQQSACFVGSAINFVDTFTKEVYSFGGTETSITLLSKDLNFSKMVNPTQVGNITCIEHDRIFRLSYQSREAVQAGIYNDCEICYPIDEPNSEGKPRWCMTKGANISCYSVWDRQGDDNVLVTGRGDTGRLMYHGRGFNWDDQPMVIKIRTKDSEYAANYNLVHTDYFIDGKPSLNQFVTFRTYLDSRLVGTTYDEQTHHLNSETSSIAGMVFTTQARILDRIEPFVDKCKGNTISFEIVSDEMDLDFELLSIRDKYEVFEPKLFGHLVGG